MMFARALIFAFIPFARAWGNLTGLYQALDAFGLDQFANATTYLNSTPAGQQVLIQLSEGNKTIFAPSDSAWSSLNSTALNETALADIISYHIVSGNFVNKTETYPNETVGRTLLNNPNLVMLGGNQTQALVWSKTGNESYFVINKGTNVTVTNTTTYNDTAILAINSLLDIPPNISSVLKNPSYNTSSLAALLQSATLPNGTSILDVLNSAHGITVFAPNNAGIQAARGALSGISKNSTALLNVVSNHVINGTAVYANELSNSSNLVSAAGQNYAFNSNSTGQFVSVGGYNPVQIVEPNVLTSNGVIHIVNGVMLDTNSNAAAASSAYASATSVVAQGSLASSLAVTSTFTSTSTSSDTSTITSTSTFTSASTTSTSTLTSTSTSTPTPTSGGMARGGANNWKMGALVGVIVGVGQLV